MKENDNCCGKINHVCHKRPAVYHHWSPFCSYFVCYIVHLSNMLSKVIVWINWLLKYLLSRISRSIFSILFWIMKILGCEMSAHCRKKGRKKEDEEVQTTLQNKRKTYGSCSNSVAMSNEDKANPIETTNCKLKKELPIKARISDSYASRTIQEKDNRPHEESVAETWETNKTQLPDKQQHLLPSHHEQNYTGTRTTPTLDEKQEKLNTEQKKNKDIGKANKSDVEEIPFAGNSHMNVTNKSKLRRQDENRELQDNMDKIDAGNASFEEEPNKRLVQQLDDISATRAETTERESREPTEQFEQSCIQLRKENEQLRVDTEMLQKEIDFLKLNIDEMIINLCLNEDKNDVLQKELDACRERISQYEAEQLKMKKDQEYLQQTADETTRNLSINEENRKKLVHDNKKLYKVISAFKIRLAKYEPENTNNLQT